MKLEPKRKSEMLNNDRELAPGYSDAMLALDGCFDDESPAEMFDRATVELLQAEVEELRSTIAMLEAESTSDVTNAAKTDAVDGRESAALERLQLRVRELSEEANRADERVLILEDLLQDSEEANRAEQEERAHLEAWLGDIERRFEQKDRQHREETDRLSQRVKASEAEVIKLRRMLKETSCGGDSTSKDMDGLINVMQGQNQQLQKQLDVAQRELMEARSELERQSGGTEMALREERAKIAQEFAEVSRLKFELAQKIQDVRQRPQEEVDEALQKLLEEQRHTLRKMREKSDREAKTLSGRLRNLLLRVEDRY